MKTIKISILNLMLLAIVFTSCKDDSNLFGKSSAERLNEAKAELQSLLTSSPDGWELIYFTDTAYYGGYNLLMKFTDTEVTVQGSNRLFPQGQYTSKYSISFPQSVALTFDTYNPIFSLLGDPDNNSLTGTGEALGGENYLLWMRTSNNKDTIVFKNKNSNTKSMMIRYTGNWDEHFNKINLMLDKFSAGDMDRYFRGIVTTDGNLLFTGFDYVTRNLSPLNIINDSIAISTNGVVPVEDGFIFAKPVYINGKKVTRIRFDETINKFVVADEGIQGEMYSIAEPSFVFSGLNGENLNQMVFLPKTLYEITGASREFWENIDSVLVRSYRILNDEWGVWGDGYYGIHIYPYSYSDGSFLGHSLFISFFNKDDDWDVIAEAYLFSLTSGYPTLLVPDNSRPDKLNFKRPPLSQIFGWESNDGSKKLFNRDPSIRTYFQNALNLLSGTGTGAPYIIIPSTNYKDFTFGSTQHNFYFKISYRRTIGD